MSSPEPTYKGTCFCGAVEVTATGAAASASYCHCRSCQKWHGAPINAWTIWHDANVSIVGGVVEFDLQGGPGPSHRLSCKRCGGAVANRKPKIGMTVLYFTMLAGSGFEFRPRSHIYYAERVLDVHDGLPKFADMPSQLGGSGDKVAEPGMGGVRT